MAEKNSLLFHYGAKTFSDNERSKDNNLLEVLPQKQSGVPGTLALSELVVKLIAPPGCTG